MVGLEFLARRMDHWTLWIYSVTMAGLVIYWYVFIASNVPLLICED